MWVAKRGCGLSVLSDLLGVSALFIFEHLFSWLLIREGAEGSLCCCVFTPGLRIEVCSHLLFFSPRLIL